MHFGQQRVQPLTPLQMQLQQRTMRRPVAPMPYYRGQAVMAPPPQRGYVPMQTIVRTVPDYAAIQRARAAQEAYDRERFALQRAAMHDRRAAARLARLQQELAIAQAQAAAQGAAATAAQQAAITAASQQFAPQQGPVSPSAAVTDLAPAQDAAAAEAAAAAPPKSNKMLIIGGVIAVAAVGGYMIFKKHKKKPKSSSMEGARRRRKRRWMW